MKKKLPDFQASFPFKMFKHFALVFAFLSFSLSSIAQLSVTLETEPILCGSFASGVITATPSGGIAPYSYLWSNGSTSNPITTLPIGTYEVTVTDNSGATATASATLTSPPPLNVIITQLVCAVPGSMTANVTGGVPPYMYMWGNGGTTPTISNLSPGEYCITVMDANSCGFVTCESVGPQLSVTVPTSPVDCATSTGGIATAIPNGGVTPFTYEWSNGEITQEIDSLMPGTYTVTVTAGNDCTAVGSGTVGISPANFDIDFVTSQPTCSGMSDGSITANASGGMLPYSYEWSNGENTQTIDNLLPGAYTLTVTDVLGCSSITSTVLTYQSSLILNLTSTNPTCVGSNNGTITSSASGGVEPYSYLWNTGATTPTLTNQGAGAYSLTVTDAIGCSAVSSSTLTAPVAFTVDISSTNASNCGANDGSVSALPMGGGTPPFSYLWNTGMTNSSLTGIPAGVYTVTVTSSQGCTASASATVSQPNVLDIDISGTNAICENENNGMLTAGVTYGTAPFSFAWSNGGNSQTIINLAPGNYSVTVTSSEGCIGIASSNISESPAVNLSLSSQNLTCFANNSGEVSANVSGGTAPLSYLWNTGSTSTTVTNLPAGNYSVTVTDASGCTDSESVTLTQPDDIIITFDIDGSCGANGSVMAQANGGTPGYTYAWSNGQSTASILGLAPGDYILTVTDANGCSEIQTANVPAFPLMNLVVNSTNTTCNGAIDGTVTAQITGGTAPFDYLWSNGSTQSSQAGLPPGNYSVTVTDDNGCQIFGSASVMLGDALNVTINAPTHACPGQPVSATAEATGGTPSYTYSWSNGQTNQTATGLTAGSYSVTVTDPSSCTGSASIIILTGGQFDVNPTVENVACFGETSGSVTLNVTGGATPIVYSWSNGATASNIQDIPAGNYAVTVSDQTGCEQILNFEITEPNELSVGINGVDGICGSLASASANVSGGTPGYAYQWSNGGTASSISNMPTGTYSLTVTDNNACTATSSAQVEVIPSPTCEIVLAQAISSINGNDGELTVEVTGGTAPFSFLWSNGQSIQTITGLSSGNYSVTVTDADGCVSECDFNLLNPAKLGDFAWLDEDMDGIQDADEMGFEDIEITLTGNDDYGNFITMTAVTDATGMYMFLVQPGTYKLTVDVPSDYILTEENVGDDALDSDVNSLTSMTPNYTIGEGETNLTIDIGLFESPCENLTDPGTICCDQTLCGPGLVPDPLTETSPPMGGVGAIEYLWMYSTVPGPFGPGAWLPIPSATGPNYAPGALYETTYFVRCTRREGCSDFLETNQVAIIVDDVAVAEILAPSNTCVGDPISFASTNSGPEATYSWAFQGAVPATANTPSVNDVVWNSFGVKMVTLAVENDGCTSYDTMFVNVSNSPTICGGALIIDAGQVDESSVMVEWDFSGEDTSGLSFEVIWAVGQDDFEMLGKPSSVEQTSSGWHFEMMHKGAVRGSNIYRVSLTDEFGETMLSNMVEVEISRTEGDWVEVYPNPFSEVLRVDLLAEIDSEVTIEIFDALGRQSGFVERPEGEDYFEVSTVSMAPGTYFIYVKQGDSEQMIFKMIK